MARAARAAGVLADRNGWRDGEKGKRKSAFLSAEIRPFRDTELRIEGEVGRVQRRIPNAKLTDRFGGWDGVTTAGLLASLPSTANASGIDRRQFGDNLFVELAGCGARPSCLD